MKAFAITKNNSAMTTRYAFMSMMADATCSAMLLGTMSFHASRDKLATLIILYNVLSVSLRAMFAVWADKVTNKHTGVRMSVLIIVMGFMYPVSFGLTAKAVLMSVGNASFHAFASSSVLSRSKSYTYGIGLYTAGSIIGLGLAEFVQIFGYFSVSFLMMGATPSDKSEQINKFCHDKKEEASEKRLSLIFTVLLLVCIFSGNYMNNSMSFEWNDGRNTALFICLAAGIGRIAGGIINGYIPLTTQIMSLTVGGYCLLFMGDSKLVSLLGIMLINMSVPIFIGKIYGLMPGYPAMCYALASIMSYLGVLVVNICPISTEKANTVFTVMLVWIVASAVLSEVFFSKRCDKGLSEEKND